MTDHTYNPLERRTFEAIAYNAVGRASEINTYPSYELVHSTGNSGWSVGAVQWDFGQPGYGAKSQVWLAHWQLPSWSLRDLQRGHTYPLGVGRREPDRHTIAGCQVDARVPGLLQS